MPPWTSSTRVACAPHASRGLFSWRGAPQAIGAKLRDENEALRVAAREAAASRASEVTSLKDDKGALESAIRAASLSSDLADDYELQVLVVNALLAASAHCM